MSESTHESKPPGRGISRWWLLSLMPLCWLLSLIFHGGLLAWLTWFVPGGAITPRAHRAEDTAGGARIREVMNQVRERQADLLKERVRELQDIQAQLAALGTNKLAEYRTFAGQFAAAAPSKAVQAQAEAAKAQAEVRAAQVEAQQAVARVEQANDTNSFAGAATAQKKVMEGQARLDELQEVALQTVMMGGAAIASAAQAQADANSLQSKADMAQVNAAQARESALEARHQARRKQTAVDQADQQIQRDAVNVDTARANAETAEARAAQARKEADEARAAAAQAKTDAEKPGLASKEHKTAISKLAGAQGKASRAVAKVAQVETTAGKLKIAVSQAQAKVEQTKVKAAQAKADAGATVTRVASAGAAMVQAQAQARQLQDEAGQAQARAQQALAAAMQAPGGMTGGAPLQEAPAPMTAPAVTGDVNGMNLADLYQAAVATETTLTETYRNIRAMELSLIRQIPLAQALKLTDVAKALRPDLTSLLGSDVTSGDGVAGARQAVQTAANEVNSMLSLGNSMLTIARGQDGVSGPQGATVTMASFSERASQALLMERLAAEDPNARAKDLSGAMRNGPGGAGGAGVAAALAGGQREIIPVRPPKISPEVAKRALPTRKIMSGGLPGEWMFVDSWYIVGPWDNRGRVNIDKKFPPETVVDLDASYVGKDSRPIRWEFVQTPTPEVAPSFPNFNRRGDLSRNTEYYEARKLDYIIYYACTALYFDQDQDLWIAVGSDDFSKIWIDDQLVWASGKEHKPWLIDEGYRKVHFRKGVNRILYRVENGQYGTAFSLAICLKPGT